MAIGRAVVSGLPMHLVQELNVGTVDPPITPLFISQIANDAKLKLT